MNTEDYELHDPRIHGLRSRTRPTNLASRARPGGSRSNKPEVSIDKRVFWSELLRRTLSEQDLTNAIDMDQDSTATDTNTC